MTVQELMNMLIEEVIKNPDRGEQEVFVFLMDNWEGRTDGSESPLPIYDVDLTISDRIDINI